MIKAWNSSFKTKPKPKINYWANIKEDYIFKFINFNLWNTPQNKQILKNINLEFKKCCVISIIGPSGSGKSTLLNTMNKNIYDDGNFHSTGELMYKNINIIQDEFPIEILRTQIGIVSQKPIMFHMSIKENLIFALRAHGINEEKYLNKKVEELLKSCFLWEELKDRLNENPTNTLSGGQQQRLCIARALALNPLVLLMDEPTSSLDPISNNRIEDLIMKISKTTTVIIVSHSLTQVRKISDYTLFLKDGEIIEFDNARKIFTNPREKLTRDYVSSKY